MRWPPVRGEMGDGRGGRKGVEAMAKTEVWFRERQGRRGRTGLGWPGSDVGVHPMEIWGGDASSPLDSAYYWHHPPTAG